MWSMLKQIYRKINLLNLDVVLGSMLVSLTFWKLPAGDGEINIASVLILGVATWLIYILDRFFDIQVNPQLTTERHLFHHQYFFNLSVLSVVLGLIAITLCFIIPRPIFYFGLYLAGVLLIYFLFLIRFLKDKKAQWIKEPMTAVGYSIAVVGPAFVMHPSINLSSWILALMLFLIASQNLLLFSYFEMFTNERKENSAKLFGQKWSIKIIRLISGLMIGVFILLFTTNYSFESLVALTLLIMSLLLSFMTARPTYFLHHHKYRWIGDGVFLLLFWVLFY